MIAGCSSEDHPDSGIAMDAASTADSGAPDSGRFGVVCGSETCAEAEYCYITPTGPCTPNDGGACAAAEESCQKDQVFGCTTPRNRACTELPAMCASNPSCPCLINANLCPQAIRTDCLKPQGM